METYSDINDFKSKFYRQLQLKLNADSCFTSVSEPTGDSISVSTSSIPDMPALSREAQVLLKEASQDTNGTIMRLVNRGGLLVQSNGREFMRGSNPKDEGRLGGGD